jgi:hypothetical protein
MGYTLHNNSLPSAAARRDSWRLDQHDGSYRLGFNIQFDYSALQHLQWQPKAVS